MSLMKRDLYNNYIYAKIIISYRELSTIEGGVNE